MTVSTLKPPPPPRSPWPPSHLITKPQVDRCLLLSLRDPFPHCKMMKMMAYGRLLLPQEPQPCLDAPGVFS